MGSIEREAAAREQIEKQRGGEEVSAKTNAETKRKKNTIREMVRKNAKRQDKTPTHTARNSPSK